MKEQGNAIEQPETFTPGISKGMVRQPEDQALEN